MVLRKDQEAFFALLQAGLWEKTVRLVPFGEVDYQEVMRLAEEQSVVGLIAAGIEQVADKAIPKEELLQFIGRTLQIEEQNKAMNCFIADVVDKMREEKINAVLVKGQGVARSYEKPLWRSSGDVDLLLDEDNYEAAKIFFAKMASSVEQEELVSKHIGFTIGPYLVELHGHMYFGLSPRAYKVVLEVEREILRMEGIRVWNNDGTDVFLPNPDNDIIILFIHFLGHFCFGGVGFRQLCDLCRLLWTYKEEIKPWLLKQRLERAGLMSEWKVFAAVAVDWLGMPAETMPFYDSSPGYKRKARRACAKMLKYGNFGHNIDDSYRENSHKLKVSLLTFGHRFGEFFNLITIFPIDSIVFFVNYLLSKIAIANANNAKG